MIGERSNKLLSQFVVLFQNILVLSGGQDLCMASDVITNMSYKPSYIDRQRIFNAFMLYSTVNSRVKGFSEGRTNLNFRLFSRF